MNNKAIPTHFSTDSPPPTMPAKTRRARRGRRNGFKTDIHPSKVDIIKKEKKEKEEFKSFLKYADEHKIDKALDLFLLTKGQAPQGGVKASMERRKIINKLRGLDSGSRNGSLFSNSPGVRKVDKLGSGGKGSNSGSKPKKMISEFKSSSNTKKKESWGKGFFNFGTGEDEDEDDEEDDCFSSDEEEDEEQQMIKQSKWIINPEGRFKWWWDQLNVIMVLYVAIFAPLKFSYFDYGGAKYPVWDVLESLVDLFFFIDLVLNFFTPVYKQQEIVLKHWEIAKNYFKFWFWLDFLSIFPFQIILDGVADFSIFLKVARLPRLWKVLRAAKLLRTFRVARKSRSCMGKLIYYIRSRNFLALQLIPYYIFTLSCGHILACIWHMISVESEAQDAWLNLYGYQDEPVWDRYWASLYYTYTTITTTGYGDITPHTIPEMLFTLAMMVFGVIVYSWIYSTMMDAIKSRKERYDDYENKKLLLKDFKVKEKLFKNKPQLFAGMMSEIEIHQRDFLIGESDEIKHPKFKNVKPQDQKQLMLEVLDKEFGFTKLAFFRGIELNGSRKYWLHFYDYMEKRVYDTGDIIYESGSQADEFFVIRSGVVWFLLKEEDIDEKELCQPKSSLYMDQHLEEKSKLRRKSSGFFQKIQFWRRRRRKSSIKLPEKEVVKNLPFMEVKSFFGEFELFDNSLRWWTVMAKKKTTVYVVKKNDFLKIFEDEAQRLNFFKHFSERLQEFKFAEEDCLGAICAFDEPDSERFESPSKGGVDGDMGSGGDSKGPGEGGGGGSGDKESSISKFSNRMSLAPNFSSKVKKKDRLKLKRSFFPKEIDIKDLDIPDIQEISSSSESSCGEENQQNLNNRGFGRKENNYMDEYDDLEALDSHREPLNTQKNLEPEVVVFNINHDDSRDLGSRRGGEEREVSKGNNEAEIAAKKVNKNQKKLRKNQSLRFGEMKRIRKSRKNASLRPSLI